MTTTRTRYELTDGIATITMDDGKVNAVSPDMSAELLTHFDRAETERDTALPVEAGVFVGAGELTDPGRVDVAARGRPPGTDQNSGNGAAPAGGWNYSGAV